MKPPSPERWQQVEQLLDAALELPSEQHAAFLGSACADAGLRAEVERLLRACEESEDFLEQPAQEFAAPILANLAADLDAPHPAAPGARIGPYRILEEAGRGGMAVVYLAERADGQFRKRVALKVVWTGLIPEAELLRRFREERQILAGLEHPGIARLVDGGVTEEGLPWFAMEYVEGVPIERYCDEHRLPAEARLALFCAVCDAVQHAHRRGIVHRDLKPGNILVTEPEEGGSADGRVKLLDFGIAKLLAGQSGAEAEERTRPGLRLMTPEYASPEQVRGEAVTPAADVYALGVLLYRLLCGRHPYPPTGRSAEGIEHLVLVTEPEPPSAAVCRVDGPLANKQSETIPEAVAAARSATPEQLRRRLQGDLDAVVLKALSKDSGHRYADAGELAAELRRHLQGLRVEARQPRRHKRVLLHGSLAVLSFLLIFGGYALLTRPGTFPLAETAHLMQGAPDVDPQAYELYVRARDYAGRSRQADSEIAAGLYRRALEIDSTFALARAALSTNYALGVERHGLAGEWTDSAISQAERALTFDPASAEAYRALGVAYRNNGWLRRSLEAHERASALDSTVSPANVGLAHAALGRLDEAVRLYRLAIPKAASANRPVVLHNLSYAYGGLGLFDEAEEANQRAVELSPDLPLIRRHAVHLALLQGNHVRAVALAETLVAEHAGPAAWISAGRAQLTAGDPVRAREHLERAYAASPLSAPELLAAVLWNTGERERARLLYTHYETDARARIARGDERWVVRYGLGVMYAVRGEKAEAYRWLNEAVQLGWGDYYATRRDPFLAELHGEPAFEQILARQKAAIDSMRRRVEREGW
jgi:serine/threonine protein kinase/Tfp pilus assembly protein PilF